MSKISRDRFMENWCWKASSERDAICNHALRILRYRRIAKQKSIPIGMAVYMGIILGLSLNLIYESSGDAWPAALLLAGSYGALGLIFYVPWRSIRKSEEPIYDWAENYRELLEERKEFRKEEREQDLPRRKF